MHVKLTDILRTTLGPRGLDKLVYDDRNVTISNDGATVMGLLDIVHPAAQTLVQIAKSQDAEVGDGTTSVVLLAGELLKRSKEMVLEGVNPHTIVQGYREACALAKEKLQELSVKVDKSDKVKFRELLEKCGATALNSKLIANERNFFAKMVVDAVLHLDEDLDLKMIGLKKVPGGGLQESLFVEGVAFKKTFSYAGFEQQPKHFVDPKILMLNIELELKAEKDNAEVRVKDPDQYQKIVDAEWKIIYNKLDAIVNTGAKIVLSRLAIGDLATQYFADRNIFCAGRVPEADMNRVAKSCGGAVLTTVSQGVNESSLGRCAIFEEKQIGKERFNFFSGAPKAKSCTIILRGGGEQFNNEAERSIHDAIMVVRRAMKHSDAVGGGGAVEMELSKYLRNYSRTIHGKKMLIVNTFAKALEVIPRQLAENAGFDSTNILNKLRQQHALEDSSGKWVGVDIINEGVTDCFKSNVWEPALVRMNALGAATEAACQILIVDETVKNPRSQALEDNRPVPPPRR